MLSWAVIGRTEPATSHSPLLAVQPATFQRSDVQCLALSSLESTLTKNTPVTHPESTLTKSLDLKPRRINTYEKRPVWGCADPATDRHPACPACPEWFSRGERSRGERAERAEGSPLSCCAPFVPERSNLPTFKRSNSLRSLP